ncbi:hypothetical protein [Sporosarcina sp. E16_8]|uniref:hypothetical protein n=1 Tax=Sporosarcina sp. E16_8 TaxID=2789295 RepID=UPI001A92DA2B|nr:hypothetical protein [Sporosarcina sp. E16_8]MBO0587993.1 hypothetical protein [Sporosarcina sp. E16_8]
MQDVCSIIAFSPNSKFKFNKDFTSAHVIQFPDLLTTISQYKEQHISEATVKGINEKLSELLALVKNDRKLFKAKHMQSIRKAKDTKRTARSHTSHAKKMSKHDASLLHTACPKCNGRFIFAFFI